MPKIDMILEVMVMTKINKTQSTKVEKSERLLQTEQIDLGVTTLKEMAKTKKQGFTLAMAIAKMLPAIEQSFAAGYTHQEICTALKENAGITIAPSTLKGYVREARAAKKQKGDSAKQKPKPEMQFPQPPN
jgi:hypothetical protein